MFTVIIPLYNKAEYITKAIQSVLGQTFNDFELIIIDDGSTDNSLEVVRQFTDARIRIINQENAGVSTARNSGVKAAKNEYIAFLDADDWWDTYYLAEMQQLVHKYPDARLWAAKYYKVKNGRNIEANIGLEKDFKEGYIDYIKVYAKTMWMPLTASSFVADKAIFFEAGGYNSDLKIGEDFDLWVRIAIHYKMAYINKPLVYYNQDVDLSNRAVSFRKFYSPENHFIFQLDYLSKEESKRKDLKQLLDNIRAYSLLKYHVYSKSREKVRKEINKIDFSKQSLSMRVKYLLPKIFLRAFFYFKKLGSIVKSFLLLRLIRSDKHYSI